jgi:MoxR-like ATPase
MSIDPHAAKSCANCPSFTKPGNESVSTFKKSLGVPMCGRFGTVLGKIDQGLGDYDAEASREIQKAKANSCSAYGEPKPAAPIAYDLKVAIQDLSITPRGQDETAATTCLNCTNYVTDITVNRETGFMAGMCRAKGKLILAPRTTAEAIGCDYAVLGINAKTAADLTLLPEYQDGFNYVAPHIREMLAKQEASMSIDPQVYETDKPPTALDLEEGVRAWRAVFDPRRPEAQPVYLPIYERSFFDDHEQVKIPATGSDEHPELYVDHDGLVYKVAVLWRELDETPVLWGMAGTGKTELYRHMAWLMQLPFERFSITASTELDDLAGKMHYSPDKGTYFIYGRLPEAWSKPCVICLDEPNTGQPDVWQYIRPLTDNSRQMVLDSNNGERISRNEHAYFGMAMNPAWDPRNVGANTISDADGSRIMHIEIGLPSEEVERRIIADRVALDGWTIDKPRMDALMGIARDLRDLSDEGSLTITWGIRPQIKVARAMRWFDMLTAYRMGAADFLEPEQRQQILDTVKTHMGSDS